MFSLFISNVGALEMWVSERVNEREGKINFSGKIMMKKKFLFVNYWLLALKIIQFPIIILLELLECVEWKKIKNKIIHTDNLVEIYKLF
jgi:hypothetical protein